MVTMTWPAAKELNDIVDTHWRMTSSRVQRVRSTSMPSSRFPGYSGTTVSAPTMPHSTRGTEADT